jgi:heterodisulfide reductase subunit A
MRVGCYICRCGPERDGQISSRVDVERLAARLRDLSDVDYVADLDVACGEAGQDLLAEDLRTRRPDRVVIAACSPRDHEQTFRSVLERAGTNPYLMHLANIREQVAWVTAGPEQALDKAEALVRAGVARVAYQEPLVREEREVCTDVMVIGAGPAGHRAALVLAEAGRRVTLVERSSLLGGLPVRVEDLFPALECAPCLMEPVTGQILHGDHPGTVDVRLLTEVVEVKGSLGNLTVRTRGVARHVSVSDCVGCGECVTACPVTVPDPVNLGRSERRAIDFELFGGLPSVPVLDPSACARHADGESADPGCTRCRDACPLDDVVDYDDLDRDEEHRVGAIIVTTGATEYDAGRLSGLGYGLHPDVLTARQVERLLAANGPTAGELLTQDGRRPQTVAIVNCAGSMDPEHVEYCSGICCRTSLKFHHLITRKAPDTSVVTFFREMVVPGKEAAEGYRHAKDHPGSRWVRYQAPADLRVEPGPERIRLVHRTPDGGSETVEADLVVLMTPLVPDPSLAGLAATLDIATDPLGFLAELNPRSDVTRSSARGIHIAGSCRFPADLPTAMAEGAAAAGQVLATLVEGRPLLLETVVATVDDQRCSGCLSCLLVCPFQAVGRDDTADPGVRPGAVFVDPTLCAGCGTCVASCPTGAMRARHFGDEALLAEIQEVLR